MDIFLIVQIAYILLLIGVALRIIFDTQSTGKALAFLMMIIFVPIAGVIAYFIFGVNHRKHKIFNKKLISNSKLLSKIEEETKSNTERLITEHDILEENKKLVRMIHEENHCPVSDDNDVQLLINGEQKFPELFKAIEAATHHIHVEYYIYEDDETGRSMEELLIKKAKEGVEVRFIYDDLGSRSIKSKMVPRLREAGVMVYPFHEIKYMLFANRINYRNHRKIIVIDGSVSFVGGINVGDNYINGENKDQQFWRDSHLKICGSAVYYLQYLFIGDWNFCAGEDLSLEVSTKYFPDSEQVKCGNKLVQIASSGPDSDVPAIQHSIVQAINLAKEKVLITTPYFVPNESLLQAICMASRSGVKVSVLVPDKSDSKLVDAASEFYYIQLLNAGVNLYLYHKGFVHSKSLVIDDTITVVGTANMDERSFDLNFEVNAIVYDHDLAVNMSKVFDEDIQHAKKVDKDRWENRSFLMQLRQNLARLFSPIL